MFLGGGGGRTEYKRGGGKTSFPPSPPPHPPPPPRNKPCRLLCSNSGTTFPTDLHSSVEDLEHVMLQCDRGKGGVGQNGHHSLVDKRKKRFHGLDVL